MFGLTVANQVRNEMVSQNLSSPLPASGRYLMLGGKRLTPTFCASPIKGANPIPGVTVRRSIHQGDLFHGKLNLQEIKDTAAADTLILSPVTWIQQRSSTCL